MFESRDKWPFITKVGTSAPGSRDNDAGKWRQFAPTLTPALRLTHLFDSPTYSGAVKLIYLYAHDEMI